MKELTKAKCLTSRKNSKFFDNFSLHELLNEDFPLCILAIPALQPIIHDLFVLRAAGKSEIGEDLETQREVVVSMLLRLVHYPEV